MAQRIADVARHAPDAREVYQEKMILTAPIESILSSRIISLGESAVADAPLMIHSDPSHVWLTVYIKEIDLGHIDVGWPAEVTENAFPDHVFEGHITHIAPEAEFTRRGVQTQEERANIVFKVKIAWRMRGR